MTWQEKIEKGLALIIEGCKENTEWGACYDCPFAKLCDIIYLADDSPYSYPENYEKEGLYQEEN